MKRIIPVFILIIFLSACASQVPQVTVTSEVTVTLTSEPTQTSPAPATETQPAAEPTQAPIEFHHGLAPTMDEFTKVNGKEAIDAIVEQLAQTEQPFGADIQPIIAGVVTDQQGNPIDVILRCNENSIDGSQGDVNCVPVASLRYTEGGEEYYVVVLKIKNADGTNGFFRWSISGGLNDYVAKDELFARLSANPEGPRRIAIPVSMQDPSATDGNPIYVDFVSNLDNVNAMLKFAEADILPEDFTAITPANAFR